MILSIVGVDVLGDPKECNVNGTPGRSSPTNKGGSICKNSAVLFTFHRFYGIIQLIDKLEFDEVFLMKLRLVKASIRYCDQIKDMLDEWNATGEKIIPYAIRRIDYHDFTYYCDNLEVKDAGCGLVPDSTFFCLDEERNIIVGAVNIRHYLNESLFRNGGHIGDGVRPSERRKGIATKMIALALEECKKLGITKVLMVCEKENIGSAKSIQNNGGILENEIEVDGVIEQRYWIELN